MARELIYGRQPVRELFAANRRTVYALTVARSQRPAPVVAEILASAARLGIPVREAEPRELDRVCGGGNHQGVAAEAASYTYADLPEILRRAEEAGEAPLVLLLDHVQDPQNVGSLIRSAEAAGVHGVVIPRHRSAEVTPAVARASAGATEHMRTALVGNLAQTMEKLKARGIWLAGLEALPEAQPYTKADLKGPLGLVVGSEGEGLARLTREGCDFLIRLPMRGRIRSLNVSAATAVALYEIRRQRDGG